MVSSLMLLVENSLAEDLKTTTLVTAISRNVFHVFTSIAALVSYLSFKYPCMFTSDCSHIFGTSDDSAMSSMITVFLNYYFLADILSLPQDIYYLWATTSDKLDPSDSFT